MSGVDVASQARALANARANGKLACIADALAVDASPAAVRHQLLIYYRLRDATKAERKRLVAARAPMAERIAAASVAAEIEHAIEVACTLLRRVAHHGGRGLPPPALESVAQPAAVAASAGPHVARLSASEAVQARTDAHASPLACASAG